MPAVTPPAAQPTNVRLPAPLSPPATASDREDPIRAPRSKSVIDRSGVVTLEPHWIATIDAATD